MYDVERGKVLDTMKGNELHLELIWGTPNYFTSLP